MSVLATALRCHVKRPRVPIWDDLPGAQLEEFFEFMEVEYSLDAGLLRPEDQLELLTAPIKTKNPWRWFLVEPRIEDAASELNYEIWKRAQTAGLTDRLPLSTVGEYVRSGAESDHRKQSYRIARSNKALQRTRN